ncbi:MAG: hypothetical protein AAF193_00045 [Bacteroidota bacterium]
MEDSNTYDPSELDHTPLLKSLKKENGFSMPEGSGENIMEGVMKHIKTAEFDVPQGTFDQLPSYQSSSKSVLVIPLWAKVASIAAAAACIAFLVFTNTQKEECLTFACLMEQNTITESDLEYFDFEVDDLELYIETDDSFLDDNITDEDLEEYILDADINIDDLWDE